MAKPKPLELADLAELFNGIEKIAKAVAMEEMRKFAESEASKFRGMIERQEFRAFKEHPLSKGWAVYKKGHGLDPRAMMATKTYVDSIKVWKTDTGFRIGFEDGKMAEHVDGSEGSVTLAVL